MDGYGIGKDNFHNSSFVLRVYLTPALSGRVCFVTGYVGQRGHELTEVV